jgi:lactobin A/cerein 7B family class IIb bacteriocin
VIFVENIELKGLSELNDDELRDINGGSCLVVIGIVVICVVLVGFAIAGAYNSYQALARK